MEDLRVLSVSELTRIVKGRLEGEPQLQKIAVEGELSNFKHHASGHMYFTLKDGKSRLRGVMFRSYNQGLKFNPTNGDTLIAIGSVGVYEVSGEYQLYVSQLLPKGVGSLHIAFEELKAKLEKAGFFARKRPLPFLPQHIAVITSPQGAAVRDVLSVIQRRFPSMSIRVIPATVQGDKAPASIIAAFETVAADNSFDVVILARGGGSIEELWGFNDEQVALAIYNCPVPVISGVGHETDFTIADFVADCRAPTPSAAAELAVPERRELILRVDGYVQRLSTSLTRCVQKRRQELQHLVRSPALVRPLEPIGRHRQHVDERLTAGETIIRHKIERCRQSLQLHSGKLDSLSPLATLRRGYSVCRKLADATVVSSSRQVQPQETIEVLLHQGRLLCNVEKGEEHPWKN